MQISPCKELMDKMTLKLLLYQDKRVIYGEKWFLSCWLVNSKLTVTQDANPLSLRLTRGLMSHIIYFFLGYIGSIVCCFLSSLKICQ